MVSVPTVTGMTESDAFKSLETAGFSPQALPSEFNKTVSIRNRLQADPGGRRPSGQGQRRQLRGLARDRARPGSGRDRQVAVLGDLDAAEGRLQGLGQRVDQRQGGQGSVMSQNPPSGVSVAKGSTVSITVASGPTTAKVPAVIGKTEAEAKSKLSEPASRSPWSPRPARTRSRSPSRTRSLARGSTSARPSPSRLTDRLPRRSTGRPDASGRWHRVLFHESWALGHWTAASR